MVALRPTAASLALISSVLSASCAAQTVPDRTGWLRYWPAVVILTGKLSVVQKYGPPNYGENPESDLRLQVPILELSRPMNVRGDSAPGDNPDSFDGVTEVQLILGPETRAYSQFIDRQVIVSGTLSEAVWGHHFTKVVMDVKTIDVSVSLTPVKRS